jgi:uncharacterized protein (UPF0210 family)
MSRKPEQLSELSSQCHAWSVELRSITMTLGMSDTYSPLVKEAMSRLMELVTEVATEVQAANKEQLKLTRQRNPESK